MTAPDRNAPAGWCAVCRQVKPPRAHHCMVTNRCVLRMDHFCPWTNQTIGFLNYRHFFLFLVYMAAGALFMVVFALRPFLAVSGKGRGKRHLPGRSGIMLMFALSCAVGLAVAGMAAWHGYLIATNCTTIEFYHNAGRRRQALLRGGQYRNPYDLGSASANWEQVLGAPLCSLRWLLPSVQWPHGNGMEWRTRGLAAAGDGFTEPESTSGLRPELRGWGTFFAGSPGESDSGSDSDGEGVGGGGGGQSDLEAGPRAGAGAVPVAGGGGEEGGAVALQGAPIGGLDGEGAPTGLGQWMGGLPVPSVQGPAADGAAAGEKGSEQPAGPVGGRGGKSDQPGGVVVGDAGAGGRGGDAPGGGAVPGPSAMGLSSRQRATGRVLNRARGQMMV